MQLAKLFRNDHLTLAYGTEQYVIYNSDHRFKKILDILKEHKDADGSYVMELLKPILSDNNVLREYESMGFTYNEMGELFYKGEKLPVFSKLIIENLYKNGFLDIAINSIVNFFDKVKQNPDLHVKEQLFRFLENGNMPLLENGNFLAYKIVDANLKSIHPSPDGTHIQHVLDEPTSMDRSECDNNPNQTCSTGLHFCSKGYLPHYGVNGQKIITVEVDPVDVTSIPNDYNFAKGRCCKYIPRSILDNEYYIPESTVLTNDLDNLSIVIKDSNGNTIIDEKIFDILPEEEAEALLSKLRVSEDNLRCQDDIEYDMCPSMTYEEENDDEDWDDYYEEDEDDESIYRHNYSLFNNLEDKHNYKVSDPDSALGFEDYIEVQDALNKLKEIDEKGSNPQFFNIAIEYVERQLKEALSDNRDRHAAYVKFVEELMKFIEICKDIHI